MATRIAALAQDVQPGAVPGAVLETPKVPICRLVRSQVRPLAQAGFANGFGNRGGIRLFMWDYPLRKSVAGRRAAYAMPRQRTRRLA